MGSCARVPFPSSVSLCGLCSVSFLLDYRLEEPIFTSSPVSPAGWHQALVESLICSQFPVSSCAGVSCANAVPRESQDFPPLQVPIVPTLLPLGYAVRHLTLTSGISPSRRHDPLASSHFPGNTEAGLVHRGQKIPQKHEEGEGSSARGDPCPPLWLLAPLCFPHHPWERVGWKP